MIPPLQGDELYRTFVDELKSEVDGMSAMTEYAKVYPPWEELDPHLQIAWGRLGRRIFNKILNRFALIEFEGHNGAGKRL